MSDTITTLLDAAYEWERSSPDRLYMTQPLGNGQVAEYTWRQTFDEARRMAAHLRSLDLPPGSNIALISKNCAHFIICDLAIWMAGHASIALYPTLNADTVAYILDHSDSHMVFVGKLDDWDDIKHGIPATMPRIALPLAPDDDLPRWDDIIAQHEPITDNPTRDPDELCLMCYTSGSTGQPKGVMHSFRTVSIPGQLGVADLGITSEDRMLSYLPLAHVFERANVEVSSFFSGMQVFFSESLGTFLDDLRRARPTLFISVPRLWLKFQLGVFQKIPEKRLALLLKLPVLGRRVRRTVLESLGLEHVRMAGSGSAPIPRELIEWYESLGVLLLEGYGMTEDFAWSHMSKPDVRSAGSVGVPAKGVETRISDDGEIQIRSPGNMLGYYKQPELTAQCYTDDGFFRTGDRGTYNSQGLLNITGRVKEIFKTSKGKYVAPAPIENLLNTDNHIELCCVSGSGRPAAHAVVQLAEEIQPRMSEPAFREEVGRQMESLLAQVNAQIEEYESLQFIAIVSDVWDISNNFLTPTLKIKRDIVEAAYADRLDTWYDSGARVIWQD